MIQASSRRSTEAEPWRDIEFRLFTTVGTTFPTGRNEICLKGIGYLTPFVDNRIPPIILPHE
jgi:hypothetical protein